jgi:murein DD-endopeptidase MepM/ murein hydrolase activator NlpD
MSAEQTEEEASASHRPLPSVDMPLLKEQRRAVRTKQLAAMGAAGVVLVGGAALAFLYGDALVPDGGGEPDEDASPAVAASAPAGALDGEGEGDDDGDERGGDGDGDEGEGGDGPAARVAGVDDDESPTALGAVSRTVHRFGNAPGFRPALSHAGASEEEGQEIEDALGEVMDFRRCRPTDQLVFERDSSQTLVLFEYRGSATEYYQATRDARGNLRGERVEVPIDRTRMARGGRVESSLGAAFERAGLGRALVGRFMEVFEAKANFNTHARRGDTFRILVDEERVSGHFLRWGTVHAVEYAGQRTGVLRGFYFEHGDEGDFYDETGRAVHGGWLRTPLHYERISSRFNPRRLHPILRRVVPHNGVDYAAGTGTPVWAAAAGTITFAGERGANGNLVSIRHAGGYESFYAHLSRIERGIQSGTAVRQRQIIGYVGSTGRSTGPHLHFGLKKNGRFADPLAEINGPGRMLPAGALGRFRTAARRLTTELEAIDVGGPPPTPDSSAEDDAPEQEEETALD